MIILIFRGKRNRNRHTDKKFRYLQKLYIFKLWTTTLPKYQLISQYKCPRVLITWRKRKERDKNYKWIKTANTQCQSKLWINGIFKNPHTSSIHLPMLTSRTLSSMIALQARATFWIIWIRPVGLGMTFPIFLNCSDSTSATRVTPSQKSFSMSCMTRPLTLSCSLIQLVNVFLWISTQRFSGDTLLRSFSWEGLAGSTVDIFVSRVYATSDYWYTFILEYLSDNNLTKGRQPRRLSIYLCLESTGGLIS